MICVMILTQINKLNNRFIFQYGFRDLRVSVEDYFLTTYVFPVV